MIRKKFSAFLVITGATMCSIFAQDMLYPDEFSLSDVKLLDGPFKKAMDLNGTVLKKYTMGRLLYSYRREAGLSTQNVTPYTNWAGSNGAYRGGLDGHVGGHYLAALAMHYAATGDKNFKKLMDSMVVELKKCQDANGTDADFVGYVGGVPEGKPMWRKVRAGDGGAPNAWPDFWVPWYNVHKMYAGLRDAYVYGGNETAKDMFLKFCDWGIYICANLDNGDWATMLGNEHGGMNEVYADAYKLTNDSKYLDFAKKFSHKWLLDAMAKGTDNLDDKHANTQVPKAIGFARIADLAEDEYYHKAADFFWHTLTEKRSIALGGNSRDERFPPASKSLELLTNRNGVESCNTHNMLKLTEDLFRMKQDPKYLDFYERALFNHILSTQHPTHGGYVYFTSMHPKHYRVYSAPDVAMWCCVGTGMENHEKYGQAIYAHHGDSLFVNLFIASEVYWNEVTVKQETSFPDEEQTKLTIDLPKQFQFNLFIRHPSWVPKGQMKVIMGSDTIGMDSDPSSYIQIGRTWNGGETLTVLLPMHFNVEQLVNIPEWKAITRGPIIMGAKTATTDIKNFIAGADRMGHSAGGTLSNINTTPKLSINGATFQEEFEPVTGKPFTYKAPGIFQNQGDSDLEFMPFYRIHDSRYIIYWNATVNGDIVATSPTKTSHSQKSAPAIRQLKGGLGLSFQNADKSRHVAIFSLAGQKIADIPAFTKCLYLDYTQKGLALKNGTYALQIKSKDASKVQSLCVVR